MTAQTSQSSQPARTALWLPLATGLGFAGVGALLIPSVREQFTSEGVRWLYILLFSFAATFALTPASIVLGTRWGFVDQPSDRKIHGTPTPRIGGLAVYLGFVSAILVNSILEDWMAAILVAGSLLLIVGILDDAWELPAWSKLVAQLAAAGLVIYTGKVLSLFPDGPSGDAANILLTFIWIVGFFTKNWTNNSKVFEKDVRKPPWKGTAMWPVTFHAAGWKCNAYAFPFHEECPANLQVREI